MELSTRYTTPDTTVEIGSTSATVHGINVCVLGSKGQRCLHLFREHVTVIIISCDKQPSVSISINSTLSVCLRAFPFVCYLHPIGVATSSPFSYAPAN